MIRRRFLWLLLALPSQVMPVSLSLQERYEDEHRLFLDLPELAKYKKFKNLVMKASSPEDHGPSSLLPIDFDGIQKEIAKSSSQKLLEKIESSLFVYFHYFLKTVLLCKNEAFHSFIDNNKSFIYPQTLKLLEKHINQMKPNTYEEVFSPYIERQREKFLHTSLSSEEQKKDFLFFHIKEMWKEAMEAITKKDKSIELLLVKCWKDGEEKRAIEFQEKEESSQEEKKVSSFKEKIEQYVKEKSPFFKEELEKFYRLESLAFFPPDTLFDYFFFIEKKCHEFFLEELKVLFEKGALLSSSEEISPEKQLSLFYAPRSMPSKEKRIVMAETCDEIVRKVEKMKASLKSLSHEEFMISSCEAISHADEKDLPSHLKEFWAQSFKRLEKNLEDILTNISKILEEESDLLYFSFPFLSTHLETFFLSQKRVVDDFLESQENKKNINQAFHDLVSEKNSSDLPRKIREASDNLLNCFSSFVKRSSYHFFFNMYEIVKKYTKEDVNNKVVPYNIEYINIEMPSFSSDETFFSSLKKQKDDILDSSPFLNVFSPYNFDNYDSQKEEAFVTFIIEAQRQFFASFEREFFLYIRQTHYAALGEKLSSLKNHFQRLGEEDFSFVSEKVEKMSQYNQNRLIEHPIQKRKEFVDCLSHRIFSKIHDSFSYPTYLSQAYEPSPFSSKKIPLLSLSQSSHKNASRHFSDSESFLSYLNKNHLSPIDIAVDSSVAEEKQDLRKIFKSFQENQELSIRKLSFFPSLLKEKIFSRIGEKTQRWCLKGGSLTMDTLPSQVLPLLFGQRHLLHASFERTAFILSEKGLPWVIIPSYNQGQQLYFGCKIKNPDPSSVDLCMQKWSPCKESIHSQRKNVIFHFSHKDGNDSRKNASIQGEKQPFIDHFLSQFKNYVVSVYNQEFQDKTNVTQDQKVILKVLPVTSDAFFQEYINLDSLSPLVPCQRIWGVPVHWIYNKVKNLEEEVWLEDFLGDAVRALHVCSDELKKEGGKKNAAHEL